MKDDKQTLPNHGFNHKIKKTLASYRPVRIVMALTGIIISCVAHTGAHKVITAKPIAPTTERYHRAKLRLQDQFNNFDLVELKMKVPVDKSGDTSLSMRLNLGSGRDWNLKLTPSDPRSKRYRVRTIDGEGNDREVEPTPSLRFYSGKVDGDPESDVRIGIEEKSITGYVFSRGTKVFVEPLRVFDPEADRSTHIVYTPADVKEPSDSAGERCPD